MEKPNKARMQVLAAGAAIAVAGYGLYSYMAQDKDEEVKERPASVEETIATEQPATDAAAEGRSPAAEVAAEEIKQEDSKIAVKLAEGEFTDPGYAEPHSLKKEEADKRSRQVSDVSYKTAYALLRGGDNFHGQIQITFTLTEKAADSDDIFVDYKGERISELVVNGTKVAKGAPFRDHRIYFPREHLRQGANVVSVRFVSKYTKDCMGVQYFKDKEDGEEYLYTDHEASNAHREFPCFDQPDLKASYTLLVVAPTGWVVIANAPQIRDTTASGSKAFTKQLQKYSIDEASFTAPYGGEAVNCFEFGESFKISPYLFCFVAGPYVCFESDKPEIQKFKVPLRMFSRKSIAKYAEKQKEEYFWITKCGIEFYEKTFATPYPFEKLDQVWVPDYCAGAMENVGLVIYNDGYVQRDELFSSTKKQGVYNTFLHEISHQWFGNLVTMKWWDDLWLNEAFANFVSYLCLDEAEGLEEYTAAWSIFLVTSFRGLATDQQSTTHPISVEVPDSDAADDIFDGISYGKGAAFLNQAFFLFGREVFLIGLASYFKEYAFQNTQLADFVRHMSNAAATLKIERDFAQWARTWLQSAGCNIIWHEIEEEAGVIKKFTVHQKAHVHGIGNQLRIQKYKCAFYDEDMKIIKEIDILTKSDQASFELEELAGTKAPFAYHINYRNYGFAKFIIDDKSLDAFQTRLSKIEDSLSRRQLYYIMWDMLRLNDLSGARLLDICKTQLMDETAVDVLTTALHGVIPVCIETYCPLEAYEAAQHDIFELLLDGVLTKGAIEDSATRHSVLTALIDSARSEDHYVVLMKWFEQGFVTNSKGDQLQDVEISAKHKHSIIVSVWSSQTIAMQEKERLMEQLKHEDSSGWLDDTTKACQAALPDNKQAIWDSYFTDAVKDWGVDSCRSSFSGFNQPNQRQLLTKFEDDFFEKICPVMAAKGTWISRLYFQYLKPTNRTDDAIMKKYADLLEKAQRDAPEDYSFAKMIKDTIAALDGKKRGQAASVAYLNSLKPAVQEEEEEEEHKQ